MIDVDWSSLMPKQKQEPRTPGAALLRFTPGAVLLRAGVSRRLAGPRLLTRVKEVCAKELEETEGESTHNEYKCNKGLLLSLFVVVVLYCILFLFCCFVLYFFFLYYL